MREYLLFLHNPEELVNANEAERLTKRIEASTDPIDKLKALALLEVTRHPAEAPYRQAFIEHAKDWARENDVPAPAFLQMGVDPAVLAAAGIASSPAKASTSSRKLDSPQPLSAGSGTSVDTVKTIVSRIRGTFTLAQVKARSGASEMTVRKALQQLIDDGRLRRLGPDPTWRKKGRAPILYELA